MLAALALVLALTAQEPFDVRADLSLRAVPVGTPVSITVTVDVAGRAASPTFGVPELPPGVRIIGTYTSQETQIMMPGGRRTVIRREYRLLARIPGEFTIPPITVTVNGEERRTRPLELTVVQSGVENTSGPVQLRTSVTPPTAYVGQQIILGMAAIMPLTTRNPLIRGPSFDPPAPDGFWIQDLPDPITIETDMLDGGPVEVQTYQRALFPLSAGTFTIPAGRIVYETRTRYFRGEMQEVRGEPLTVTVLPLPDEGRPADFPGAVGRYSVTGSVDRVDGSAGDAFTYTLVLEGEGNIKALQPPSFPDMDGVEVYPPSEDAALRVVNARIGGTRTFQWVFIPRRAGSLEIPPVRYSWFDPAAGRYVTGATDPVTLNVTPATPARGSDTALAALRLNTGSELEDWTKSGTFLLLNLIPLGTLLAALTLRAHRGSAGAARRQRRAALRRRDRALAAMDATDTRAVHTEAIHVVEDVRAHAHDSILTRRCDALIAKLRTALYAAEPPTPGATDAMMRDVHDLVQTALRTRRWPGTVVTGIVALLALGMAAVAYADARTDFANGIAAWQRADFATAVTAFDSYTAQAPADANGWYNLGMAAHRADEPGRAIFAWLRAYERAPRADDVMHNLGVVNAAEAAAAKAYWVPVSDAELRIAAAVCWWLLLLGLAIHVLRPARALRIACVVVLAAGALAGVALIARAASPDIAVPLAGSAALYAGPTSRTESVGQLEAGGAATVLRREGGWLLVRSPSLLEGWVQSAEVGIL